MPGLYIHIPFCRSKCRYCDFPSYAGMEDQIPAYLAALEREMQSLSPAAGLPFDTVFIGGGTPSLLSGEQVARLLQWLGAFFSIEQGAEITLECNPGTVNGENLQRYWHAGVNRLSIGLQSANDALLQRAGRIHTREAFLETYRLSREAGFANINVDIMHGLPGQRQADYYETLELLFSLAPSHISAYELILEEGTTLKHDVEAGAEALPDEAVVYDMQDEGMQLLEKNGYQRYEVSNFSQPGMECRHNINYWQNGAYIGIGAGAHSAWQHGEEWVRWENPKEVAAYLAHADTAMHEREFLRISQREEAFETVMLGLRMTKGVHLPAFEQRFGVAFTALYPKAIERLEKTKWLVMGEDYARLTPFGMDMQNTALWYFLDEDAL